MSTKKDNTFKTKIKPLVKNTIINQTYWLGLGFDN